MGNSQEREIVFNSEQEKFVARRMVVKIGSSTITGNTENLDVNFMENIARQVSLLINQGVEVMIVTSGAVASGKKGLQSANDETASMSGQTKLIMKWCEVLNKKRIKEVGHLLLTDNDLVDGLGSRLRSFLRCGVLVINGQDALNDLSESRICKDNDKLAGFLTRLVNADTLLLLTDKDGVLDKDGKTIGILYPTTEIVIFDEHKKVSNGGISSKVRVAQAFSGKAIIANGKTNDVVLKVARGEIIGTEVKQIQASFFNLL